MNAQTVVSAAQAIITERVANQPYRRYDWSSAEVGERYFAVERSLATWAISDSAVAVSVVATPDGALWGYLAAEVLDRAASDANVPFETALISQDENSTIATLTW